ncbi:hypothetical protein HEP84_53650 [Streptomyces sp. RLB1-33]|uniref:hypothetical protein n=1 Tax=Streptomyces mirabilis TaxID=68239 RepID=UPI00143EC12C|nr:MULTISPECIES: hypothetical protein [Streptomyces]QIY67972.1 hypothetical protein HEP84_00080 [Streptomyces sp. RLB1-33]QIY76384.1 hypothetical protein HEP84_53650 [Streptomyces sp. RLB1-33]QUW84401.1 hypothetical protein SMIR_39085 [Streptomyces mirabilis]QUW84530.1 hypothetical protein SMIR_40045 [Streptomyces mirabilis]
MSYDLAVWDGELPRGDEAGAVFDALYERYLDSEDVIAELSPRIETYVEALVERYPDDVAGSPWASPPVMGEASGPIVYLLMSYSRAEEVSEYAAALAREHGLVCYDPQGETLRV